MQNDSTWEKMCSVKYSTHLEKAMKAVLGCCTKEKLMLESLEHTRTIAAVIILKQSIQK